MITRAISPITGTLETGDLTFPVYTNGPSEVEVTGTFGSVVLSTSTATLAERTITADERFKSEMQDMLFTLTGTGPVVVRVTPMER
jgi:hypothetical protein